MNVHTSFRGIIRDLVKAALAADWVLVQTKNGAILRAPDGVTTIGIHTNAGGKRLDPRSEKNIIMSLKRAGVRL